MVAGRVVNAIPVVHVSGLLPWPEVQRVLGEMLITPTDIGRYQWFEGGYWVNGVPRTVCVPLHSGYARAATYDGELPEMPDLRTAEIKPRLRLLVHERGSYDIGWSEEARTAVVWMR